VNLLLDTHILLWAAGEPEKLSPKNRALLTDNGNRLFFSSASIWEITIKRNLGRDDFQVEPRRLWRLLLLNGYQELAISSEHAVAVDSLPHLHKDPFDRILLAQAKVERLRLLSVDQALIQYGEPVIQVNND
jgi:PIN domain nuclease of toxin-antitoxin system